MSKNKAYSAMNATEKTKYIGFKIFSERELNDRQKKAVTRRVSGFRKFMGDIVALPHLELGKHMDENALGKVFQEPINNFYDYATKSGLSPNDLEAIMDDIIQCAFMFKRTMNEASTEQMRFTYAFTGENQLGDVSLKDLATFTAAAKENFKRDELEDASEYANEPSLSQTEETVADVVEEKPAEEAKPEGEAQA